MNDCQICGESLCKHGLCRNTGSPWTDGCKCSYGPDGYQCQDCAEAQEQAFFEAYWGGESVFCESATDRSAREREEKDGKQL